MEYRLSIYESTNFVETSLPSFFVKFNLEFKLNPQNSPVVKFIKLDLRMCIITH